MKERCIKLPVYWFEAGLKDMKDNEAGRFLAIILDYGFNGNEPDRGQMTEKQKALFEIGKRDIDYQKKHPRSYKFPENEKTAIRRSGEYNQWRKAVFSRDEYTCQSCGQVGGTLNAHHIKRFSIYPDKRLDIENGITLCKDCHRAVHRGEIIIDKGLIIWQ